MSCFHLSNGGFGNKSGSRVFDLVRLMEGALLDWSEFAKGFCTGALELPTFKLWHLGRNSKHDYF